MSQSKYYNKSNKHYAHFTIGSSFREREGGSTQRRPLKLDEWKSTLLKLMYNYQILFIQAPPGIGKTTGVWTYACELTEKQIWFIFPSYSYLNKNYEYIHKNGKIGGRNQLIGSVDHFNPTYVKQTTQVFTTTVDIFLKLLLSKDKNKFIKKIGFIIIDEAHIIDTKALQLGLLLSLLYENKIFKKKIIFLSATLVNTVAIWYSIFKKNTSIKKFWFNIKHTNKYLKSIFIGDARTSSLVSTYKGLLYDPNKDEIQTVIDETCKILFCLVQFYNEGDIMLFLPSGISYEEYIDKFKNEYKKKNLFIKTDPTFKRMIDDYREIMNDDLNWDYVVTLRKVNLIIYFVIIFYNNLFYLNNRILLLLEMILQQQKLV